MSEDWEKLCDAATGKLIAARFSAEEIDTFRLRAPLPLLQAAASYQELRHGEGQATETGEFGGAASLPLWEASAMNSVAAMQLEKEITPQEFARRKREFHEVTEPIRKNMLRLMLLQPFSLTMCNGITEREILWEPRAKAAYDQGQEMIEFWAERILGKPTNENP